MDTDDVVYIGSRFWNTLGDEYTYNELLEIAASVGSMSLAMIQEMISEWMDEN